MKTLISNIILVSGIVLCVACNDNSSHKNKQNNKIHIAKKTIYKKIDADALGLLKDFRIDSIVNVNDSTFIASHIFFNTFNDRDTRITRRYILNKNLDRVISEKEIHTQIKSLDDWVTLEGF